MDAKGDLKAMELKAPQAHEIPPKHELAGLRRGHFCRLKADDNYFWVMATAKQAGVIFGIVESSFPGGPERGSRVAFTKWNVFEIT